MLLKTAQQPTMRDDDTTQSAYPRHDVAELRIQVSPPRRPTEILMDSFSERPDVAFIAVLGYN